MINRRNLRRTAADILYEISLDKDIREMQEDNFFNEPMENNDTIYINVPIDTKKGETIEYNTNDNTLEAIVRYANGNENYTYRKQTYIPNTYDMKTLKLNINEDNKTAQFTIHKHKTTNTDTLLKNIIKRKLKTKTNKKKLTFEKDNKGNIITKQ